MFIRCVLLGLSFLLITGCSYISMPSYMHYNDRSYLDAKSIPPLKTPPGISSQSIDTYYPIPNRNYPPVTRDINIEPPGLNN